MSEWYDIPSEEMTLEQARSAVRELREKVAEQFANMQNEWISVKDRLPDDTMKCLVYAPNGNITHWMLLPEPPKENKDET